MSMCQKLRIIAIILFAIPASLLFIPCITFGVEEDPLKDMDLELMMEQNHDISKTNTFALTGYLESRNQFRMKDIGNPVSLRQRLWLEGDLGHDWIRGFASGYFDYDLAVRDWTDEKGELYYLHLNEAYLTVDTEKFDLIVGRKMMRWGTGDGINPMDLINPRDYRDPISGGRSDTRVPILLADGMFLIGSVTVEGVIIPKPEVNKFSLPDSPWEPEGLRNLRRSAATGAIVLSPAEKPDNWFSDAEYALKISTVWKGCDLALLYYNGYTDNPAFHRKYLADGKMQFTATYPHYQAYGLNFAKGFDRVTIRGELAAKKDLLFSIDPDDKKYREDSDGLVGRNLYQGVIGIDRTFFTDLYTNFQFFADYIADGQKSLVVKRKTHGIAFEIRDKFLDDDLSAGFRGSYFTSNDGSVIEIFAEYKIGDNWQIAPGCLVFNGSQDSRFGQYRKNDMFYLRLRYSF